MKILHKFSALINSVGETLISSHLITLFHIIFVTGWLLLKLDLTVLALLISVEGLTIWTIVLKSTGKIREGQEKKDRFENKRFREFLENDVKLTEQNLKMSRELFIKMQDMAFKVEEVSVKLETLTREVGLSVNLRDKRADRGSLES